MRLMRWDIDIVHRNVFNLVEANYWSQLGMDICFDPLFQSYLNFDQGLCERFPAPRTLPMKPESIPYYRGPRITTPTDAPSSKPSDDGNAATEIADHSHCQSLFTAMVDHHCHGIFHLATVLVHFGDFDKVTPMDAHKRSNLEIPAYGIRVL